VALVAPRKAVVVALEGSVLAPALA